MGSDTDGDAGPLFSPACIGYRYYTGGGQPPPPTVPPVQHTGALMSAEWVASCHSSVRQGGGYKLTVDGRRGDAGECGEGLSGLWKTARGGYRFQIYGLGLDSSRRRTASGSGEPEEVPEELGTADKDPGTGG